MIKCAFALLSFAGALLHAGPVLTFNPPGSNITGTPLLTSYWNFQVVNDTNFLLVTQVNYLTLTPAGNFTDLFSPVAPVIGPGDTVNGTSSYLIDLLAPPGYVSTGQLQITYDEFNLSPNDPGFDPDVNLAGLGKTVSSDVSVTVNGVVPEPSTFGFIAIGAFLLAVGRERRQ